MQKDVHSHTQILQERNNRLGKQDNEINQFFVNVGLQISLIRRRVTTNDRNPPPFIDFRSIKV